MYLDGNNLQCAGSLEIVKICAEQAEYEAFKRAEEARQKEEEKLKKELGKNVLTIFLLYI